MDDVHQKCGHPCFSPVFTWYGVTIEMDGATETYYTADETAMVSYVNVHDVLNARRNRSKASLSDSESSQSRTPDLPN